MYSLRFFHLGPIYHHISVGSHLPSCIRWIPSTIIYPLDPIYQYCNSTESTFYTCTGGMGEEGAEEKGVGGAGVGGGGAGGGNAEQAELGYYKALWDAKFVLSPPGFGADCYRTWQALYFGALPVGIHI
jgi:hypothetical protein